VRRDLFGTTLGLIVAACVGENPDWDQPGDGIGSTATATATATGDGDGDGDGDDDDGNGGGDDGGGGGDGNGGRDDDGGGDSESGEAPSACKDELVPCEIDSEPACVDLRDDAAHCGACFHACDPMLECEEGTCRCPGGDWAAPCNGVCVDTKDDPLNCGQGCVDCTALFGDDASCDNGICNARD
jgi:hypothetical protein